MSNPQIQTDIAEILGQINHKLDTIGDRLNKLEVGQTKIEGKLESLDEKLSGKIESVDEKLSGKIKSVDENFQAKSNPLMKSSRGKSKLWTLKSINLIRELATVN